MKLRNLLFGILSVIGFIIAGCGGGGGGTPASTTFSGVVSKGPVQDATVNIFRIDQSGNKVTPAFAQGRTDANGNYNITVGGTITGPVLVEVTHGRYKDEANPNVFKNISTEFPATGSSPGGLRAFLAEASGATGSINVTPLTEMAVQKNGTSPMTSTNINAANNAIATAFFGAGTTVDIVKTKPLDPTASFPTGATDDQKAYALKLAAISQYSATTTTITGDVTNTLLSNIAANNGQLAGQVLTDFTAATTAFVNSAAKNPNGTSVGDIVTSLDLTASATTSFTGNPLTLTATVVRAADPAPTGETVSFMVSPATSATLSAASQTTTSGVATVTLTGSALGQATVTATAGSMSKTLTFNFVDPNAPQSMTVTSSAPAAFLNGSLTLTANVVRAAGGPVPDGTVVTFAVTSGTGTLGTPTTTVGGVATVTLTSAVAGAVTVTATAGTVITPVSFNFVVKPTTATVKVATTGTLPANTLIGNISAVVTYDSTRLTFASAAGSGVTTLAPISDATTPNQVLLFWSGVLFSNAQIPVGEFTTVTFNISPGITPETMPTASDFALIDASSSVTDLNGTTIPGISVVIQGVQIQ
ncbi:hypothetical protein [Geobacter sp.]|uniref:hypothetical protein n=1 Tax=Geobacter sp. TaxID=46610 RepID=UPI00260D1456|nr:hypothetical protein [Geobacter sp.]